MRLPVSTCSIVATLLSFVTSACRDGNPCRSDDDCLARYGVDSNGPRAICEMRYQVCIVPPGREDAGANNAGEDAGVEDAGVADAGCLAASGCYKGRITELGTSPMSLPTELSLVGLKDGRILFVQLENDVDAGSALFEPDSGHWSSASFASRAEATATLLDNGDVLFAGGVYQSESTDAVSRFNPATGAWWTEASMKFPRRQHTATALRNGNVLVLGGFGLDGGIAPPEVFNTSTSEWLAIAPMRVPRTGHAATLLPDGTVLVTGGRDESPDFVKSVELLDFGIGAWVQAPPMHYTRAEHSATVLTDGLVLVVGGKRSGGIQSERPTDEVELYSPNDRSWRTLQNVPQSRRRHRTVALRNGEALVVGGLQDFRLAPADPAWFHREKGNWDRLELTGGVPVQLADGRVLIVRRVDDTAFAMHVFE